MLFNLALKINITRTKNKNRRIKAKQCAFKAI